MDKFTEWSAYLVDLDYLFAEWDRLNDQNKEWDTRFREIHSICMFALLVENQTDQRYLIGFQKIGAPQEPLTIREIFKDSSIVIENDCDVLLVDCPKQGESEVDHHRIQLTSFTRRSSTSEKELVEFLRKKLRRAPDSDLRLVIHIEQSGTFNLDFLNAYLNHEYTPCPYSQVFIFGQVSDCPRVWTCSQIYPEWKKLPDLDERTAKILISDRPHFCQPPSE